MKTMSAEILVGLLQFLLVERSNSLIFSELYITRGKHFKGQ